MLRASQGSVNASASGFVAEAHLHSDLKSTPGTKVRPAERIAEVECESLAREVQNRRTDAEFMTTGSKQPRSSEDVEELPRAHSAAIEIDEVGAWPIHQLIEFILVDFQRCAAFVPAGK